MERARLESQWNQTALVACQIANVLCMEKRHLLKPDLFNPFAEKPKRLPETKMTVTASEIGEMLKRGWGG